MNATFVPERAYFGERPGNRLSISEISRVE